MSNGEVRDVSREAFLESANSEVALAGRAGLMTAVRRGEAPVLARFEGNYASTTMTVMGDRTGFAWTDPPSNGKIDELVAAKWKRMKILPSGRLHRRRVPPPGLPRPDRASADRRRSPSVPGRHARQPGQAGRADRPTDRQPGFRRFLDQQVGRPAAGQSQVPGRGGLGGLPQLDPRPDRRQRALRPVRPIDPDGHGIEPGEPGIGVLQDPPRPGVDHGEHDATVPGRPVQLQQVPRPPLRALDPGPVLPDGRILRPGGSEHATRPARGR